MRVEDLRQKLDEVEIGETFMLYGALMMKVKRVSSDVTAVVNLLTGDLIYMDTMINDTVIPVKAKAVIVG